MLIFAIFFQVLEEVCNKHGFKPEEHDLKYVFVD